MLERFMRECFGERTWPKYEGPEYKAKAEEIELGRRYPLIHIDIYKDGGEKKIALHLSAATYFLGKTAKRVWMHEYYLKSFTYSSDSFNPRDAAAEIKDAFKRLTGELLKAQNLERSISDDLDEMTGA